MKSWMLGRGHWLAFFAALAGPVFAQSVDVALITQLGGTATLDVGGVQRPAQALLKLVQNDRLVLAAGATAQLVYFENARQETWSGPVNIVVAREQGRGDGTAPQVRQLPKLVAKQLARTPGGAIQGRPGAVVVRSLAKPPEVMRPEEAEAYFRRLKAEMPADDLTPEVFLLGAMLSAGEDERARQVLDELRERGGDDAARVVSHFDALVARERWDAR